MTFISKLPLTNGSLLSVLPTKLLHAFLFFPVRIICPHPSPRPWLYRCIDVLWCVQTMKLLIVYFLAFCYPLHLNGRCLLPVQPLMLHVHQVETQVHWSFNIRLTTKSEGSQRHLMKFLASYVKFVSSKHAVLRCKTRADLKSITTNSGVVPRFGQIVAVLSLERTAFERRQYGIYGGETLGSVQTFPLPCGYCFISASLIQLSPVTQNLSNLHSLKSHTMISGFEKNTMSHGKHTTCYKYVHYNTQLMNVFVKILD